MGDSTIQQGIHSDGEVYDLFVSYAHADDEVPAGATHGWVTTLVTELQKVLRRRLGGGGAKTFMDHQLAANQSVSQTLRQYAANSRAFLLVMSPGYRQSEWCQSELAEFVAAARTEGHTQCIFPIEIDRVDRALLPVALKELTPLAFWEMRHSETAARLAGYPVPKADEDSLYWVRVNELAHLIAQHLQAQGQRLISGPIQDPKPRWSPPPQLIHSRSAPLSADVEGLSLYVHAAPEDRDNARYIAKQLADAGASVQLTPEPTPGQSFIDCLRAQEETLRMCDGLLLVYGHSPASSVTAAFQYALRVFGVKRSGVWSVVLELPPADKPDVSIFSRNLINIDCRHGFDLVMLRPFFQYLRTSGVAQHA